MTDQQSPGIWDAAECALLLIDYQDNVLAALFEQDRRVVELNVSTIATMARRLDIPVVLSTVGVELGASDPVLPSLSAAIPDVEVIDRSHMNAWEDPAFVDAVKATGRKKLVIGGIVTSVCVAFPAISALADGYEVSFLADAIGDGTKEEHDTAVMRLVQAGAVPMTTLAMMAEWFRDWKSPAGAEKYVRTGHGRCGRERRIVPHLHLNAYRIASDGWTMMQPMLLRLAYLAVTNALAGLRLLPMNDHAKDVEILALRHQIAVLERQLHGGKPQFTPADRAFLAALLHRLPRDVLRRIRLLVRPGHRPALAPRPYRTPAREQVAAETQRPPADYPLGPGPGATSSPGKRLVGLPPDPRRTTRAGR